MQVEKYFALARDVITLGNDLKNFYVGAVGIRQDGVIVASQNGAFIQHPSVTMPFKTKRFRFPEAHAEAKLCKKLGKNGIIFVVRLSKNPQNKEYKMARPCETCMVRLINSKVKKIYYTFDNDHYGVIDMKNMTEKIKTFKGNPE